MFCVSPSKTFKVVKGTKWEFIEPAYKPLLVAFLFDYLLSILDVYSSFCGILCSLSAIHEIRSSMAETVREGLLDASFYFKDTVQSDVVGGVPFLDIVQSLSRSRGTGFRFHLSYSRCQAPEALNFLA